jgi:tRNA(fMet)-specific endonuclease VapC
MNLLLDTNILVHSVRVDNLNDFLEYINPSDVSLYLSITTIAEVYSISVQNKWSSKKLLILNYLISKCEVVDVTDYLIPTYVEIDTFSKRRNPNFTEYAFPTHRNMGKNDLWIAATAAFLNLSLVTTDLDFNHLHDIFLDVRSINVEDIRRFM